MSDEENEGVVGEDWIQGHPLDERIGRATLLVKAVSARIDAIEIALFGGEPTPPMKNPENTVWARIDWVTSMLGGLDAQTERLLEMVTGPTLGEETVDSVEDLEATENPSQETMDNAARAVMNANLEAAHREGTREFILEAIRQGITTAKEIREMTGWTHSKISSCVGRLKDEGLLESAGYGKYRLPEPKHSTGSTGEENEDDEDDETVPGVIELDYNEYRVLKAISQLDLEDKVVIYESVKALAVVGFPAYRQAVESLVAKGLVSINSDEHKIVYNQEADLTLEHNEEKYPGFELHNLPGEGVAVDGE